jgi:alkylation response protein AidB-like acyl-CoA dehydrogenase
MTQASTESTTLSPDGVLVAIDTMTPTIATRASEIETGRRLPADLLAMLVDAGCFRLLLPTSHGGAGADLACAARANETLARADASVAWATMISAAIWCDLVHLPRATFDEIFADPRAIAAGVINPSGSIERVTNGSYRVTGRWAFASGVQHATWVAANCIEAKPDEPGMRSAVLTPDDIEIEDTWHVSGLRGTGSHHFRATDVTVPAARTFDPLNGQPCLDEPLARIPAPTLVSLSIASVALGIAQGALDDLTALAAHKVPLLASGPLSASATYHFDLATADADLRAARALLAAAIDATWATAVNGDPLTLDARARTRIDATWVTTRAATVVDRAYRAGGGSALYDDSPLQRRLRDIHALTQHFLVRPDTVIAGGAVLAGLDPPSPLF